MNDQRKICATHQVAEASFGLAGVPDQPDHLTFLGNPDLAQESKGLHDVGGQKAVRARNQNRLSGERLPGEIVSDNRTTSSRMIRFLCLLMHLNANAVERFENVVEHGSRDARIDADPEHVVHHEVGVLEITRRRGSGLPDRRAGASGFRRKGAASRSCAVSRYSMTALRVSGPPGTNGDGEPEPARIGAGRRLGQNEELLQIGEAFAERPEIGLALLDKAGSLSSCATPTAACMSVSFRL